MGLDQFLYRKKFIWNEEKKNLKIEGVEEINVSKVIYITEEVAYWRKNNQIHKY